MMETCGPVRGVRADHVHCMRGRGTFFILFFNARKHQQAHALMFSSLVESITVLTTPLAKVNKT